MVSKVQDDNVSARFTIPSILYSPEEARGFDCNYIADLGLEGLNKLRKEDVRFNHYIRVPNKARNKDARFITNDLFRHQDKEIDLESLGKEEISRINESIGSYLRLLTDFLECPGSIETLEYLIRIYRIHVYNWEDLLLCVLHSHEKPVFVRIVQLLSIRNSKWEFLVDFTHGVPLSGDMLIQKCKEDVQVLQALCDYAPHTGTRKYPPSETVVIFSTEVVVGVLGSMTTVDKDFTKCIMSFVDRILQYSVKGAICHYSALIVIAFWATRAKNLKRERFMKAIICTRRINVRSSLSSNVNNCINSVCSDTRLFTEKSQEQSVTNIPVDVLRHLKGENQSILDKNISDVLQDLSKQLDIRTFVEVLLNSFLRHSWSHHDKDALTLMMDLTGTRSSQ